MFDVTPVTLGHIVLFGCTFLGVFFGLGALLSLGSRALRAYKTQPGIFYGGTLLAGSISLVAYVALDDVRLRIGLLAAVFLTLVVGVIDEQLKLPPGRQLVWQTVIACLAVAWGWTIPYVSHPLREGILSLAWYDVGGFIFPGALVAVVWLVFLMNAMNWLDGVDGLATGVGVIALLTLALVSLLPQTQDSRTLTLALIGAGGLLGFLLWNFPPAKVYLGTSGSWFLGLYIGLTAMIGGGKIITTLLVLALPVLDVLSVAVQRLIRGQKLWQGDTTHHIHHLLQQRGWQPRAIASFGMTVSAVLGLAALTLHTTHKMVVLGLAALALAGLVLGLLSFAPRVKSSV